MRAILLLGVALGACTTFPAIDRNVCGNGIVEPGEDCDSTDATCVACAITCGASPNCPAGYACGVDHTCHAPGGQLAAPAQEQSFPVDDFRIADIDKDGRQDILGVSKTSISVRFGDAAGKLDRASSFVTPVQSGTPSFGDLDGDGATDVTISTVDGLVAFASQYSVLSPLTTSTQLSAMDGTLEMVFPINLQVTGALLFDAAGKLELAAGNLNDMPTVVATTPCGNAIDITDFSVDLVDIYVLPHTNLLSSADDVVLTITTKKMPARPCVMAVHVETQPSVVVKITSATPAGIGTDNHKLVLADITDDSDPCPAVIDTRTGGSTGTAIKAWTGKYLPSATDPTQARCGFALLPATLNLPSTVPAGATPVGRVPLIPKVPGGPEALMMTSGIYVVTGITAGVGSTYEAYRSFRELDALAVGDLDGNGQLDAVASSAGEDDLDVLFRRVVIPGIASFQLYRLDTANVISRITVGDFDGDQIADIGYTEQVIGHERMLIAYGTSDRPGVPVEVATFGELISIIPTNLLDSSDQLFQVTDLFVIERGTGNASIATVLHGSPQRTMLSFYTPTGYDASVESFRGSIIGNFTDDKLRDVVAMTETHAWMVVGTGAGFDASRGSVKTTLQQIGRCQAGANASPPGQFCTNEATYLAWPTTTSDVIFAVDRAATPHGILVVPPTSAGSTSVSGQAVPAMTAKVPPGATLRALYAVDLDGDGANELVETFGPPFDAAAAAGPGVVLVCAVSGTTVGTCTDVRDAITAVDSTIATCIDAAPGSFSFRDSTTAASTGTELAVLCYDGAGESALFAIKPDRTAALVERGVGQLRAISVGDVTGDGVPDLVGIAGGDAGKALVVYPQCGSRDLACLNKEGL